MSIDGMPRFSDAEMARRSAAVLALAERNGVDALLIFGHAGSRRHNQADIHYLTEVAPFHEAYALWPVKGEPVLWITHHNHFSSAKEVARIPDVRRGTYHPGAAVAAELTKRGLAGRRIGLIGPFFYQELDHIRRELPGCEWVDLTYDLKCLRLIKSEEELAYQRIAAAGCDTVMRAVRDAIHPGVEERDLLVISEETAWRCGCEPNFLYLNSTPTHAPESAVPNQHISRRKLAMGDVINTELTVSYGMYSAQILRPFFLGEPAEPYRRLYAYLKDLHDSFFEAIKPGVTIAELYEKSLKIREDGYITVDGLLHGFGVDILPPSLGGGFHRPPRPFVIQPGMTLVLQPNPTTADERMGMQLGQMGVVTEDGFVSMHALPAEVSFCG